MFCMCVCVCVEPTGIFYLNVTSCSQRTVLYWCETWSLTLREERRLRLFKNRVLRRIFGPTRDEVTRE